MKEKIVSLQALRGIAILLVVISHCSSLALDASGNNRLNWLGAFGVEIFIMLSGYLAMRKHTVDCVSDNKSKNVISVILSNVKRKVTKLYPLHFITFAASIPISLCVFKNGILNGIVSVVSNLLMLQGWIPSNDIYYGWNLVSWYLSLVIFFAAAEPFAVKFLKRLSLEKENIYVLIALIIVFQTILLAFNSRWISYVFPLFRLPDFLVGGGIRCLELNGDRSQNSKGEMIGIFVIIIFSFLSMFRTEMKLSAVPFFTLAWIVPAYMFLKFAVFSPDDGFGRKIFHNKILIFFGNISMELFLTNHLICRYLTLVWGKLGWSNYLAMYLIMLLITVGISYILYYKCRSDRI